MNWQSVVLLTIGSVLTGKGGKTMADRENATETVVNDLNVAKLMLCNPQTLTPEMCVRIGQAITSAIDLLENQEPIAPSVCGSKEPDGHGCWWYMCSKCKMPIDPKERFCRRCGQSVKWE
jgi:hypothetical protein